MKYYLYHFNLVCSADTTLDFLLMNPKDLLNLAYVIYRLLSISVYQQMVLFHSCSHTYIKSYTLIGWTVCTIHALFSLLPGLRCSCYAFSCNPYSKLPFYCATFHAPKCSLFANKEDFPLGTFHNI